MNRWILVAAAVGCTPGDSPRFRRDGPQLSDAAGLPLTRILSADLDREASLVVAIVDSRGPRTLTFPADKHHRVPLVGFVPRDEVDLTVTAVDAVGRSAPVRLSFTAGGLPEPFPRFDVLADDPERAEPGYLVFPVDEVTSDDGPAAARLVALDDHLQVVWTWDTPIQFGDVRVVDGGLVGLAEGNAWQVDWAGEASVEWGSWRDDRLRAEDWRKVDAFAMNHELYPLADGGFLTISPERRTVSGYPCDYAAPTVPCGDAEIEDPHLVEFDARGDLVRDWSISRALSDTRIGFGSLDGLSNGNADWGHANAAIHVPGGGVLVSVRHQDALVAFDPDGTVRWILGDPSGWPADFDDELLDPIDVQWPYHGHGPSFGPDGTLWLFDNGNDGHTPYTAGTGAPEVSRVVGFEVDPGARTVRQRAEFRVTATGELFSTALGNAAALPATGNVLGVYGMLLAEGRLDNTALGFGSRAARLVEWTIDGEVVRDVRVRSDLADVPLGWRVYRATHTPSLYAPGIEAWDDAPQ